MKKHLFLITVVLILLMGYGPNVFATAQIPDRIFYNGQEYSLNSNPLEEYFEKFPDKRPQGDIMSSALWRGYVATFEIKDNQLFLKDIEIEYEDITSMESDNIKFKSVINEVFPGQKEIKLDWFTGLLVIPHGELVNYVHMGYGSTYEKYILLEIDKGYLKQEKNFDHKEYEKFKEKQFEVFKRTEEYEKIKTELQKNGERDDEFIDAFIRNFVTEYTSEILTDDFETNATDESPLFILNGKEVSKESLEKLDPDDIESLTVWKDQSAIFKYGDKGKNGVVEITLKKKNKRKKHNHS